MGKQDAPTGAEPFVKIDRTFRRVRRKIRRIVAQSDCHDTLPVISKK
jgi:hypothetical protein